MAVATEFRPARRHKELGGAFYDPVTPADFPAHTLRYRNQRWAERTGLDSLSEDEWIAHFGRFEPLPGSFETPLALRYHGHQFQVYNPQIGDGRGFLFAQCYDLKDGRLLDFGTKGSGQTPWSRQGDGRLTLKGGVREVLATEMLEALGVYTSKSFSLIETGEQLWRGDEPSPTRSSVLVRLSHSHIRIGSFQRLLYLDEHDNIRRLMDYSIENYLPEAQRDAVEDRAVAFLEAVGKRVADTGARWMMAGFVHGVLNTDNINITGESFDYGPWRFAPVLDPSFTAAYFDETRLYAFGRQPDVLLWNMTRLAECLLPFAEQSKLEAVLREFGPVFRSAFNAALLDRLGLKSAGEETDQQLATATWQFLADGRMRFERFFFDWRGGTGLAGRVDESPEAELYRGESFAPVRALLDRYEPRSADVASHPYFGRAEPCTMLIDEVEAIWAPIADSDDWSAFETKLAAIAEMREAYMQDNFR
ncbi:MAG: YdiU family protein [Rhizobiaceae bacterium]|nr:YdiU family protein [Rhizobiaceae bacterium]